MTSVIPSYLSSDERSQLQDVHGVCWNTDDTFDEDNPDYSEIMELHRQMPAPHWYLPHHEMLRDQAFVTELDAYTAAKALLS